MDKLQQSDYFSQIKDAWKNAKIYFENQLRLKTIIRRAQKLQFERTNSQQNIGIINSFIGCGVILANVTIYGFWRFAHKQYRNLKGIVPFQLLYSYLLISYFLVWEDYLFLNKICDSKKHLAYFYRKECIQTVGSMKKVDKFKQRFQKLNLQYKMNNSLIINRQKINFVTEI